MSEKRYIDKARLIKAIEDLPNCYNGFSDTFDKACIIGVIEELPTIDIIGIIAEHAENVQELVRCKDCRYYYRHEFFGKPYFTCDIANQYMTGDIIGVGFEPPEDWYCADGERREGEEG